VGRLHFNMQIFNELQRHHYKRSEGTHLSQAPVISSEARKPDMLLKFQ